MAPFVPEISRDDRVATRLRVLAVIDHRLQTLALRGNGAALCAAWVLLGPTVFICFASRVGGDTVDDTVALFASVEEDAGGGFAIAAGAAGFLDELLERAGKAIMGDKADVGGVDAHAEGGGGGDDVEGAGEGEGFFESGDSWGGEGCLDGGAGGELEAGVVGLAFYVGFWQASG